MEPALYFNVVATEKGNLEYSFYIIVSESEEGEATYCHGTTKGWEEVELVFGAPNVRTGVWGRDSVNCQKIKEQFEALGINRALFLKTCSGERTI